MSTYVASRHAMPCLERRSREMICCRDDGQMFHPSNGGNHSFTRFSTFDRGHSICIANVWIVR